jgi:hypothetical protein
MIWVISAMEFDTFILKFEIFFEPGSIVVKNKTKNLTTIKFFKIYIQDFFEIGFDFLIIQLTLPNFRNVSTKIIFQTSL